MFVVFLCAMLLGVAASETISQVPSGVKIVSVTRNMDASTQLVRVDTVYEVQNGGSSSVNWFLHCIPSNIANHLAYLKASSAKNSEAKTTKASFKGASEGDEFYKIDLGEGIKAGGSLKVTVNEVYSSMLNPFPSHITQAEQQFVLLEANVHVYSPYQIDKETTKVKLSPGKVESFSKKQPAKEESGSIVYGPYENTAPLSQAPMRIHFENNSPFLTVVKMMRLIEISHWGNIAVEETMEIVHKGAVLKGSFSRYDFQRDQRDKMPAVKTFKTVLPAAARDVYYRDEIGNISTSNLRTSDESVELEIRPRFPLFGGWKTDYYIGYNIPSYEYLHAKGNHFGLKMRFVDHIYDDFILDELTVKITLPEGSKDIVLTPPYKISRSADSVHYTYLDTSGRPVITAHKSNLVAEHIQDFQLTYTFDRMSMFREPLMVIVTFYLLFLVVIIYVRLDFSISKDVSSEARLKVAGIVEQITNLQAQRQQAYEAYMDSIAKYKSGKDSSSLAASRKKAEADLKTATAQINELQIQLKGQSAESAEKLNEINKLDKLIRDNLVLCVSLAEKLVGGKLQKGAYSDQEKSLKNKIDEARDKIDQLTYAL